ncbi:hypothetical protein A2852_01650 [Candidatus Adlerbacteria bacterium RIFCSPHIGHO2_01_FULL_54_23]|uniref:DUF4878 domain-containing protein n=3 Tax=Candidatus Adleribacteriota TaxID=1752736 RepID=A0A1F4Y1Q6_9BACT|nr:MAG: hypothetical protein UY83_C0003G0078 [Candidatus Adlerbacteria bacterium GW2011_GWA1_54_10]KKW36324.1 MAG: hypothetical protein UY84_C0001G0212 [Candidatus Adlerbacteria bacterium GW2011_GWA2_54_12]KKW37855.1 MAG: hypothetical protein UY86_C0003G0077 [Candidatus Adlerbacteria bacterium GW2011_GWB1_54_7]OGC79160.1 MAG: hypothetical protein A2852_01650 [Candidatus Adlerbacteria bacterium RIFCSPHIGHO2_01_FULL_54_23]OGC87263.1 MAG: hypothetical protein A3B33_02825 [Candidatus Adlerbacteria 
MNDSLPEGERKLIFKRWEFWIGVLVLIIGTIFTRNYLEWVGDQAVVRMQNILAREEWQRMEAESGNLEAAYRADAYGGATPEETLRLFVEALEKEDFVLASKYFVVEKQEENLKELKLGSNQFFINAYHNGRLVPPSGVGSSGIYEIEVFPQNENTAFGVRLTKNPFTNKWKILEL